MSAHEFNLSRYAERLQAAGVPREQALAHAELTAETLQQLVTKDYLRGELSALEQRIGERLALSEQRTEAAVAKVHADILKWMFIAVFGQGAFIAACLKLLA